VLTETLAALQRDPSPLLVIDTHAGAGAYELDFKSMREGEAAAAKRLTVDERAPAVFDRLQRVMREESARLQTPVYPGSPLLVAKMLRRGDRLLACELRADDHAALEQRLRRLGVKAEALRTDGYVEAVFQASSPERRARPGADRPALRARRRLRPGGGNRGAAPAGQPRRRRAGLDAAEGPGNPGPHGARARGAGARALRHRRRGALAAAHRSHAPERLRDDRAQSA
jgi:hypothetical protein